jgi:hypothetical protein
MHKGGHVVVRLLSWSSTKRKSGVLLTARPLPSSAASIGASAWRSPEGCSTKGVSAERVPSTSTKLRAWITTKRTSCPTKRSSAPAAVHHVEQHRRVNVHTVAAATKHLRWVNKIFTRVITCAFPGILVSRCFSLYLSRAQIKKR